MVTKCSIYELITVPVTFIADKGLEVMVVNDFINIRNMLPM